MADNKSKKSTVTKKERKSQHNKIFGQQGEDAACTYLKNKGYEIVAKNWKCNAGEADIIALIDDTLVFVDVKTHSNLDKGLHKDLVDTKKYNKYERITTQYLRQSNFCGDMNTRFGIIAI